MRRYAARHYGKAQGRSHQKRRCGVSACWNSGFSGASEFQEAAQDRPAARFLTAAEK